MQLFFSEDIKDDMVVLDKIESHHCVHVLRKAEGDLIRVIDGKGSFMESEIIRAGPKQVTAQVVQVIMQDAFKGSLLHIAIAPTKNIDRFEWFLEKATEIGIGEITPIICRHSERRTINEERCRKILISAIKQSGKALLPALNRLISFENFLKGAEAKNKFIAHCYDSPKKNLKSISIAEKTVVVIGPEGDFSKDEVERAGAEGFEGLSLGDSRLRTETAGIYVCSVLNSLTE